ncbi:TPA: DUF1353 domain-containing protein [Pseudomonas aeruginosa]
MLTQTEFRNICNAELGKPYIWGADGPDGYDCSGLVQVLLSHLNLDPAGDQTSDGLFRYFQSPGRSTPVSLIDSALADLVFYGTDTTVTHIALAWGDQLMIEAGGGDRHTTTREIAKSKGAEVRIRPITRRSDRVAILRPNALSWPQGSFSQNLNRNLVNASGFGSFEGKLLTEWLSDGRHMQLEFPYCYYSPDGTAWPVPAGTIVDGASIPQIMWSLIGGPFEGLYRNGSVIHDYYCVIQSRTWQETHRMFYDAMRCNGVEVLKAKIMFYAVYRFGPRWDPKGAANFVLPAPYQGLSQTSSSPVASQSFDAATAEADMTLIVQRDLSIEEIVVLVDSRG